MHLVKVKQGRKKVWVLADVEWDEEDNPVSWVPVQMPVYLESSREWERWIKEAQYATAHYKRFEVYRGKLREIEGW